jgi:hypothetical protein
MTDAEVREILCSTSCGRTAMIGVGGYPYVVPNLFVWQVGAVWLHTARANGHFARNLGHANRVCFEVDEPGEVVPYGHIECDTSVLLRTVIVLGRIRLVRDADQARNFSTLFVAKCAPADSWGQDKRSFPRLDATNVHVITPESMTGKASVLPAVEARWPASINTRSPQ